MNQPRNPDAPSNSATSVEKRSVLYRMLAGLHAHLDSFRSHPVWATLLALCVFVVGLVGADLYAWVRDKIMGPDDFLQALADDQKKRFADLKETLDKIDAAIASGDRASLAQVRTAVSSIERASHALVQELHLAKQENDTLRKITEQTAGVSGGYDVILSATRGIRLDKSTMVGVTAVNSQGAWISITSADSAQPRAVPLTPGQSVTFKNARGQECKLALLSFNYDPGGNGSASFADSCS